MDLSNQFGYIVRAKFTIPIVQSQDSKSCGLFSRVEKGRGKNTTVKPSIPHGIEP